MEAFVKSNLAEISALIAKIEFYNKAYYNFSESLISDQDYDLLFSRLQFLESQNPKHIKSNSPTQKVGDRISSNLKKVSHTVPMLSISNTFNDIDLYAFNRRVKEECFSISTLEREENLHIEYSCESKLDGIAVSLLYVQGNLVRGATRGDGRIGEDITPNILEVSNIPLQLSGYSWPQILEIRGEVVMLKKDFELLNRTQIFEKKKKFSNPRNAASGSLLQKDPQVTRSRLLYFYAHGLGEISEPFSESYTQALMQLNKWGLPINAELKLAKNIDECKEYYKEISRYRLKLPYEIDGVVFKANSLDLQNKIGSRSRDPRWAIAYKFVAEEATTEILDIKFQVGRTGRITPVAYLVPVQIGGVTVSRSTLHNLNEIERLDFRVGDIVAIRRAGDVIPKVERVLLERRRGNPPPTKVPARCPICDSLVKPRLVKSYIKERNFLSEGITYHCTGHLVCRGQLKESIKHFCSRKAMNIQGLGVQTINQLVDQKIVSSATDLYALDYEKLVHLKGFSSCSIQNILFSISQSKIVKLENFIYALCIPDVGEEKAKALAKFLCSLTNIRCALPQVLSLIPDIGMSTALNISNFFKSINNIKVINGLLRYGITPLEQKKNIINYSSIRLEEIVDTLSIPGLGRRTSKKMCQEIGSLKGIIMSAQEKKIPSILTKKQKLSVSLFFEDDYNLKLSLAIEKQLYDLELSSKLVKNSKEKLPLVGQIWAFTGTLGSINRESAAERIKILGASICNTVSKKTNFVVLGKNPGSKLGKARKIGIKLLNEIEFLDFLRKEEKK